MGVTDVAARVSELASRQWGLLTTAQADAAGISRLQLARLAEAEVIERLARGIYVVLAAADEHTALRAAWLSMNPSELAEERLTDPISAGVISHTSAAGLHGLGDLLDSNPEITVPGRKQSRRGIRLHRASLRADEVTIVEGLPVTTPARTVADLLRDGHDPSHVAEMIGDALRRDLASRQDMAAALEPLARRNGQPNGAALLEHLLDSVGLSIAALAANIATSDLGKALLTAGQLSAARNIAEAIAKLNLPTSAFESVTAAVQAAFAGNFTPPRFTNRLFSDSGISAILAGTNFATYADTELLRNALSANFSAGIAEAVRSMAVASWQLPPLTPCADSDEESA